MQGTVGCEFCAVRQGRVQTQILEDFCAGCCWVVWLSGSWGTKPRQYGVPCLSIWVLLCTFRQQALWDHVLWGWRWRCLVRGLFIGEHTTDRVLMLGHRHSQQCCLLREHPRHFFLLLAAVCSSSFLFATHARWISHTERQRWCLIAPAALVQSGCCASVHTVRWVSVCLLIPTYVSACEPVAPGSATQRPAQPPRCWPLASAFLTVWFWRRRRLRLCWLSGCFLHMVGQTTHSSGSCCIS